jgi:hypothetical protein
MLLTMVTLPPLSPRRTTVGWGRAAVRVARVAATRALVNIILTEWIVEKIEVFE